MNEVINNILSRRSIRKFKKEQITEEELDLILKAGAYAPTGGNCQSFKITAICNAEKLKALNTAMTKLINELEVDENTPESVLAVKNRKLPENPKHFFDAPVLIIVSNTDGYLNAMADSACAMENMMLAAHSLGLGSCWINLLVRLRDFEGVRVISSAFQIPENHKICGCLAVGYPDMAVPKAPERKEAIINIIK